MKFLRKVKSTLLIAIIYVIGLLLALIAVVVLVEMYGKGAFNY